MGTRWSDLEVGLAATFLLQLGWSAGLLEVVLGNAHVSPPVTLTLAPQRHHGRRGRRHPAELGVERLTG